ncbi:MAG TPA: 4-alpha-glucanotransferase [Anaerolineales bacterium]|nr:4-alpha-glucanotransferase [Anaerolineales bacterium]
MNIERSAGILLHPSSLPGPSGIGEIGPEAYAFVDWMAEAGFRYWQVLPLGPTGFGNSPYQCHSVFAGNTNLISPQLLLRDGLLTQADLPEWPAHHDRNKVDYRSVIPSKKKVVARAWEIFERQAPQRLREAFEAFSHDNSDWLSAYGAFMALKDRHRGASVLTWPQGERSPLFASTMPPDLRDQMRPWSFGQWLFFRQWSELREYASRRGVRFIGDAPIFVAMDSSDVWADPELFCLDQSGVPLGVAGVPPDYFAPTGQLWGNPLYKWSQHRGTGYAWWIRRLRALLGLVDLVRLDHFRGFGAYWEVPGSAATAETGRWQPGPGADFLDALVQGVSDTAEPTALPLIAEDLGVVTPDVRRLLHTYDLPGMRVLQFAFTGLQEDFLPHNYPVNCVAYTGTHDNDTSRGWFSTAPEQERRAVLRYLGATEADVVRAMIAATLRSKAVLAVLPMQDILDLGTEARMNYPGRAQGYWEWRLLPGSLNASLASEFRALNSATKRWVSA